MELADPGARVTISALTRGEKMAKVRLDISIILVMYILLDAFFIACGMGVPVFNIIFGFYIGRYIVRRASINTRSFTEIYRKTTLYALITSAATFIGMLLIWTPKALLLTNPETNYEKVGVPMILFDPKASFLAWLFLMIFIAPFLQLLTTIFSSFFAIKAKYIKARKGEE